MEATGDRGGSRPLMRFALVFVLLGVLVAALAAPARGQIVVTVTVEGEGQVVSSPEGISCPETCSFTFPDGTEVTLSASAAVGEFEAWGGACVGSPGTECQLPTGGDVAVTASFTSPQPPPPPPPGPGPPPPPPGPPGPPGPPPDDIDEILQGLGLGNVAFNAPRELQSGETAVIELLVSRERPIRELQGEITALGEREGAQIRLSNLIEARLTGLGFKIQAVSDERQPVSRRDITRWRWEIEPVRTGRQRLHLTVSAIVNVGGTESTYTVQTFERVLEIDVAWSDRVSGFLSGNWQWLWTAILLPVGAWLLQRRRRATKPAT